MRGRTLAVVFEGGQAVTAIEQEMAAIRREVCLDTLERLVCAPSIDDVVLVTSSDELARWAAVAGVECELAAAEGFHLGKYLSGLVSRRRPESVMCLGGASAPLATPDDFERIVRALESGEDVVVANNLTSADITAFKPAAAIEAIEPPESDNFLAYLLWEAGLTPVTLPEGPVFGMDADTPADLAILALHRNAGCRTVGAISSSGWLRQQVQDAASAMRERHCRVFLSGRVGPAVLEFVRERLQWRLRVVTEERGLKSTGPSGPGRVQSITGKLIDLMGDEGFLDFLEEACDVALIDTRVLFAHWGIEASANDRFSSDLIRPSAIEDRRIRSFTEAVGRRRTPILLGGHSLVNGGAWVLAEKACRNLGA
ncbi:MAG: hypothetical protein ACM3X4_06095 [Ignavibacteriales bacterium]